MFTIWLLLLQPFIHIPGKEKDNVENGKIKDYTSFCVFLSFFFFFSKVETLSDTLPSSLWLTFHWPKLLQGYPYLEDG